MDSSFLRRWHSNSRWFTYHMIYKNDLHNLKSHIIIYMQQENNIDFCCFL